MKHLLLFSALLFLIHTTAKANLDWHDGNAIPLADLLLENGTLLLPPGQAGILDLSGYTVELDELKGPIFTPVLPPPDTWIPLHLGLDNASLALAFDGNGNLFVGGDFTDAGGNPANHIAKWDGTAWTALGSGLNNPCRALALDGSGNLYAGGDFTMAGGNPANYIAKWDGTAWTALGSGLGNTCRALVFGGGNLYAAGDFTTAGGSPANYTAKWDGTAWSALGSGLNKSCNALARNGSGEIFVGGGFTTAGSNPANRIAKWNGATWSALGSGLNNPCRAIALDGNGNLYAGGDFTTAGGNPANRIAKWDGTAWSTLGSGLNNTCRALVWDGSGNLYAGGDFTTAGLAVAGFTAQWDGTAWNALGTGLDNICRALSRDGSDGIFAGGDFTIAGTLTANGVAQWGESDCPDADGDTYTDATCGGTDCDDSDPNINPGIAETCNGLDENCNGTADDGLDFQDYYLDEDGDGVGAGEPINGCQSPGEDYVTIGGDCDDNDPENFPGNPEVCDGQDNDCNAEADNGLDFQDYYPDEDGDGVGAGDPTNACQSPGENFVTLSGDCDDNDPENFPGNTEVCDGQDNDCNMEADEGLVFEDFYLDDDGDSFGAGEPTNACQAPDENYVTDNTDCDDTNAEVNPAAVEICDGIDNNCNELIDEDDETLVDDTPPVVICHPLTAELDAEGQVTIVPEDVLLEASENCSTLNLELDLASFTCDDIGIHTVTVTATDGMDNTATCTAEVTVVDNVQPTVTCNDLDLMLDESGMVSIVVADVLDEADDACGIASMGLSKTEFTCADVGPNLVILTVTDNNDNSNTCEAIVSIVGHPSLANGTPEICNNIDDDCDGQIDEGLDLDGDGFTPCSGDCKDDDPNIFPGAQEVCNGKDTDCNGLIDDGLSNVPYLGNVTLNSQAKVNAWRPCYGMIQGNLVISGFDIVDLSPLSNILVVTGDVSIKITNLTNLNGLENLGSIGRDLEIQLNGNLASLDGLDNLASVGRNLGIFLNQKLTDCCAVHDLLTTPGSVGGAKSVFFNKTGCDGIAEISDVCDDNPLIVVPQVGKLTEPEALNLELIPNPASNVLTIRLQGFGQEAATLFFYDHLGRVVLKKTLEAGESSLKLDLVSEHFKNGIYTVSAIGQGQRLTKRLVVTK